MTFTVIYKGKKFIVEIFTAHNGAEIITIRPGWYIHTELDETVNAYYDQCGKATHMRIQQRPKPFLFRLIKKCVAFN